MNDTITKPGIDAMYKVAWNSGANYVLLSVLDIISDIDHPDFPRKGNQYGALRAQIWDLRDKLNKGEKL